jgi:hypothetical protein
VATQTSPHFVVPPPHESAHAPSEQTSPVAHAAPHAPQFAGSRASTVQVPPHSVDPSLHTAVDDVPVVDASAVVVLVPAPELLQPEAPAPSHAIPPIARTATRRHPSTFFPRIISSSRSPARRGGGQ